MKKYETCPLLSSQPVIFVIPHEKGRENVRQRQTSVELTSAKPWVYLFVFPFGITSSFSSRHLFFNSKKNTAGGLNK